MLRQMATQIWVNIGSGNGVLPGNTKPLPETLLTYIYTYIYIHDIIKGVHLRAISYDVLMNFICNACSEISHLNFKNY